MKTTLQVINQMQADGVIGPYAIGGAIGATFYLEPAATFDIDVFVSLQTTPGSGLISLAPIYNYLTQPPRNCRSENEFVIIEDWPVQFLPPGGPLEEEALEQAITTGVDGIKTRVMTAEHLVAIALQLGRAKDKIRITQFLDGGVLDLPRLEAILDRHGLLAKWRAFRDKYGSE